MKNLFPIRFCLLNFDELTRVEGEASIVEFFPCIFTQQSLADFGDLAVCESIKNGSPTCYWFDTEQHLSQSILFVFPQKKCGDLLSMLKFGKIRVCLAFAQGGGAIIIGHNETLFSRDAHMKYMCCYAFVSMRQSNYSAHTRPRYFLLFERYAAYLDVLSSFTHLHTLML